MRKNGFDGAHQIACRKLCVVLCRDVLVRIINARIDLHETGHRSKNLPDLLLVTPPGGELGQLAQVLQGVIDICNRVFAQRTVIETLPGPGGQLLKLKLSPIIALTSIALNGETVDPDIYTLTGPDAGIVFCESYWAYTSHKHSYPVTYAHGYNLPDMSGADTLPQDIQQAALELCKGMWLARQHDPSVTMESVPDVYTVQYGGQGKRRSFHANLH
jgi:hypothetical protein